MYAPKVIGVFLFSIFVCCALVSETAVMAVTSDDFLEFLVAFSEVGDFHGFYLFGLDHG